MIPTLLKLSNFTSYGEPPKILDFTKFKLAAISGLNGAGKSSILDSITWCIWGTSRAGDSSDHLIHLGSENMSVEFSFELDGSIYTIKRSRSKKSGGSTLLELWSKQHNLTEGTIKATQEKIINLLLLTFETFTNSSFLRQGHDNEFTTKGSTDRKRILSEILGLSNYDKLEEKSKERSKEAATKLQLLEYQLAEINAELSQKEIHEKSLSIKEEEAKKIEKELLEIGITLKNMQSEQQNISSTIKSFEEKKLQIESIQKELIDLNFQIKLKEKSKLEFQTIIDQKEEIEKNYKKQKLLEEEKKQLDAKRSNLISLKDELSKIQKVLNTREEKRQFAIKDLEIKIEKLDTENTQVEVQIKHLQTHHDICPTCNQTIGKEKNKEILKNNQQTLQKNNDQINQYKEILQRYQKFVLPEEIQKEIIEKQISHLEEEAKSWITITNEIKDLEKFSNLYINLQQAETGIKTHADTILDLQKMCSSKESQINEGEKQLTELSIFEDKLKEVQQKLLIQESIKQELSKKALELSSEVGEAKQLVSHSEQLEKISIQKNEEKDKFKKEKDIYEELTLAFGKKGIQAMIIEAAIPEIEDAANNLLGKLTEGRMKISLQTQRETKTKTSDGEKGLVETLDIIISDEMGERPYEMYSGGETFRINFAIRLAISKLLTHRAGAKLQFLVIDEGFGSQDAPGRARLVEVIDTIKDDFEKIIIITHIEELRDEFPIRIDVTKNSEGSSFEVIGV